MSSFDMIGHNVRQRRLALPVSGVGAIAAIWLGAIVSVAALTGEWGAPPAHLMDTSVGPTPIGD